MDNDIIISVNPGFNRYNIDLLSIEKSFRQWNDNVVIFTDMVCLTSSDYKLTVSETGQLELYTRNSSFLFSTLLDLVDKILPQIYKYISDPGDSYKVKIFWGKNPDSEYMDEERIASIISRLPVGNQNFIRTTNLLKPENYCTSFISHINQ